ncbi:MAG TPA: hydroxymethylbilane synthase [Methanoregulaceae archaeon]|nr:hydroxymethylbilane synthase [Methanoregulaceae archaeon]
MPLRIGTRGSRLAMVQADKVCSLLAGHGIETEKVIITTRGDTETSVPLHEIGGQGVFVRALDDAILSGHIDAAVHSMKDIPAIRPNGLVTGAILERDSPADFMAHTANADQIRVVGTSSTRRRAQLLRSDASLDVRQLRGNVDTRLRKLKEGYYDAIILAEAGIQRMNLNLPGKRLDPGEFVPSPNQGTIAVVNSDQPGIVEIIQLLDHAATRHDVEAERAVMEEVGGGCFTPQGIYCRHGHLIAEILALDGSQTVRIREDIDSLENARKCGRSLRVEGRELIRDAYRKLGLDDDR